jgi:DNA-binding HxlR family transcriptional regulator
VSRPTGDGGAPRPLLDLIELIGRRHTLAALWELRSGAVAFQALSRRLDVAPPRLSQRLAELREAGIIEVDEAGDYRLTAEGRRLQGAIEPLAGWADRWDGLSQRQRVPRGSPTRGRGED